MAGRAVLVTAPASVTPTDRCDAAARPGPAWLPALVLGLHAALFVASCGVVTFVGPSLNNDCA